MVSLQAMLAHLATFVLIGQEVDCIQRTVKLGPVGSGVVGNLLVEHVYHPVPPHRLASRSNMA